MTDKGINSDFSNFIEELKQKNDIVSVISKYIPLEKKGRNFWGRCPFHHEKTPSFAVNPQNQFYHCFGCSSSGDVIKFIREIESVEFLEAVEILCKNSGLKMPETKFTGTDTEANKKKKERLLFLLKDCANFYYAALMDKSGEKALNYFLNRGITKEFITKFGLGYCPDYGSSINYLRNKGYTDEEISESGVAGKKEERLYDVLGERLIFPILNGFSEVIAFGGRIFEKAGFAKYRNTEITRLFNKSKSLYGINLVKKQKQKEGLTGLIIVEGYMDAIAMHQAGFNNTVASMGTSLTLEQARLVKRFSEDVFICYDGDAAGQKATIRGLDILKSEGLNVKVISVPDNLDPDDYIFKNGADAFNRLIDAAELLVDYKLSNLLKENDIKTSEGKRKFVKEALIVAADSDSKAEQEDLLKRIRDISGITYESLSRDLEGVKNKEVLPPRYIKEEKTAPQDKNIRFILYCMLNGKSSYKDFERIKPYINSKTFLKVYDYLNECYIKKTKPKASMLYEYVLEEEFNAVTSILTAADNFESEGEITQYYNDCIKVFLKLNIEEKISSLTAECSLETDIKKRKELLLELQNLTLQLKNI